MRSELCISLRHQMLVSSSLKTCLFIHQSLIIANPRKMRILEKRLLLQKFPLQSPLEDSPETQSTQDQAKFKIFICLIKAAIKNWKLAFLKTLILLLLNTMLGNALKTGMALTLKLSVKSLELLMRITLCLKN